MMCSCTNKTLIFEKQKYLIFARDMVNPFFSMYQLTLTGNTSHIKTVDFNHVHVYGKWARIKVGIATHYVLNGPGIESPWEAKFSTPSRSALWPTQPPIQWVPDLLPGGKTAES